MNISLDYTPRTWQKECHLKKQRFSVYALHRRSGKTELAIMELIDKAIKTDKELGMFVYVAPFLRQAKAIAWARVKNKIEPLRRQSVIEINEETRSFICCLYSVLMTIVYITVT